MRAAVITGTGTYAWPGLTDESSISVDTRYGPVTVTQGQFAGCELLHVSRHEAGHHRLSNHVNHRAILAALAELGADCVVSLTICGAVDPAAEPGSVVVFDDLHFPSNRLPDGDPCTFFDVPGQAGRGHWIFDRPFAEPVRQALVSGAAAAGHPVAERGCYGHVDGPRFNSRAEIAALARCGVTAVSQTGGPETVLAGEARLPFALLGFVTDYANGVTEQPTPVEELTRLLNASGEVFASVLSRALPALSDGDPPDPAGFVFRVGL